MSVVVLLSGRGSNLQALIEAGIPVSGVISNVAGVGGLAIAAARGIPAQVIAHKDFGTREAFDAALSAAIDRLAPKLVALAGFMRILTGEFTARWSGRIVNIHPSLLPKYRGLDTHARAIAAGDSVSGCSVHLVTEELDSGDVLAQFEVPVLPGDTAETLEARVLAAEHELYPKALSEFVAGR